jgi:hypothetical protein
MKYVIEYILWKDAVSEDAWKNVDEIYSHYHLIETVGFVIKESDEVLTISLNHDLGSDNFSCMIHIPQAMIIHRNKLALNKKVLEIREHEINRN